MKEIRHLLLPKNLFNLNVLELCPTNEDFKEYTNTHKHNYFSLIDEEINDYKDIIKPNYFDVIFMENELTNEMSSQFFDIINYTLKNKGKCLINISTDVLTIPSLFEKYDVNEDNFIYKNIDVIGYKRQELLIKQEELRKIKELKKQIELKKQEELQKQIELKKQEEVRKKKELEEELKRQKQLEKEKELKNKNEYEKGLKNLLEKLEKLDSTQPIKPKKNVVIKNKPKNYSVGSLSLNEKKPTEKPKSKKITLKKETPTKEIKKVNIIKQTLNKVKNKISIRPRRGSRPKL